MMKSKKDFEVLNEKTKSTSDAMTMGIVVPLVVQVILKFVMDFIWGIVYNLQLITN